MSSNLTTSEEVALAQRALGFAISQWADVEGALCLVFATACGPSYTLPEGGLLCGGGTAFAVFYAVDNFRSKLQMVEAAIYAQLRGLDEPTQELVSGCWAGIQKKASKLARRRNALAHRTITLFNENKPGRRARLVPPMLSQIGEQKPGLTIHDMERIGLAFAAMSGRIRPLAHFLGAHLGLRSRFVGQVHNLMENMRLQGDQIGLERVKRDLSWPA